MLLATSGLDSHHDHDHGGGDDDHDGDDHGDDGDDHDLDHSGGDDVHGGDDDDDKGHRTQIQRHFAVDNDEKFEDNPMLSCLGENLIKPFQLLEYQIWCGGGLI